MSIFRVASVAVALALLSSNAGCVKLIESVTGNTKEARKARQEKESQERFDKLMAAKDGKGIMEALDNNKLKGLKYSDIAIGLAKLGEWELVFKKLVVSRLYLSNIQRLKAIKKAGIDYQPHMIEFLQQTKFDFKRADYFATTVYLLVKDEKMMDLVEPSMRMLDFKEVALTGETIMGEARYAPAVDRLLELLSDEDKWVRKQACWALGRIGDQKALEKLELLAKMDTAYVIKERNGASFKQFLVRDAAMDAVKKIKLKNM